MTHISGYLRGITNEEGILTDIEEWYHQDAAIDERLKEQSVSHWFSPFTFQNARILIAYHAEVNGDDISITIESEFLLEQQESKRKSKLKLEQNDPSSHGLF